MIVKTRNDTKKTSSLFMVLNEKIPRSDLRKEIYIKTKKEKTMIIGPKLDILKLTASQVMYVIIRSPTIFDIE
jgi:hypothetical protein